MQDHTKKPEELTEQKTTPDLLAELVAELRGIREELGRINHTCKLISGGVRGEA